MNSEETTSGEVPRRLFRGFFLPVSLPLFGLVIGLAGVLTVNGGHSDFAFELPPRTQLVDDAAVRESDRYLGGWGPERITYTTDFPPNVPVLNSITDNPRFGDERNFVRLKFEDQPSNRYADMIEVRPGDVLEVFVLVRNDCAALHSDYTAATIYDLTAELIIIGSSIRIILGGNNVDSVWDEASVLSERPIRLVPEVGSAELNTTYGAKALQDRAFGQGGRVALGDRPVDRQRGVGERSAGLESGAAFFTLRIKVHDAGTGSSD